jgi:hypothetical protein
MNDQNQELDPDPFTDEQRKIYHNTISEGFLTVKVPKGHKPDLKLKAQRLLFTKGYHDWYAYKDANLYKNNPFSCNKLR